MNNRKLMKELDLFIREGRLIVTSDERHDWQKVEYAYVQPHGWIILVVGFRPRGIESVDKREAGGDE